MNRIVLVAGLSAITMFAPVAAALADGPAPGATMASPRTGAYVGARIGHGWLDATARSGSEEQDYEPAGGFAGILAGYDQPLQGPWVIGGSLDFMTGNERGSVSQSGPVIFKIDQQWEASLRGRVGYAVGGVLPYATAGLSYGSFKTQYSQVSLPFLTRESQDFGWTLGAGIDVPLDDRLALVVEYRYTDYGNDIDASVADGPYEVRASKVYLGLNYSL